MLPVLPELDPDTVSAGYGMGWIRQRFTDGTSLVWHNGGLDGFTTYIGFLPERDVGLVILSSVGAEPTGIYFYLWVLDLLLSRGLGLNRGVLPRIDTAFDAAVGTVQSMGDRSRPVDPEAVAPYVGYDEGGYRLVLHGRRLVARLGAPCSGGLFLGLPVRLNRDPDGVPRMSILGAESVRRTVGLD